MRSSESPAKRKRGLQQLNDSSPLTDNVTDSARKHRRLNAYGASKGGPKAIQALKNAFGGVFGYGRSNKDEDELSEQTSAELVKISHEDKPANGTRKTGNTGSVDASEIDELSGHNEVSILTAQDGTEDANDPLTSTKKPKLKRVNHTRHSFTADQNGERGVDSFVSQAVEGGTEHRATQQGTDRAGEAFEAENRENSVISTANSSASGDSPSESTGRSSRRERRKPRRFSNEMLEAFKKEPKSILTPSKERVQRPTRNVSFQVGEVKDLDLGFKDLPSRATQHLKGRKATPRRNSTKIADTDPRREHVDGFLIDDTGAETPEATVPAHTLVKSKKAPTKTTEKFEISLDPEETEDDTLCAICQGGDSEAPNEIIMCDNCDLAVHQVCYGIPTIPQDDWFCRDCRDDDGIVAMDIDTLAEPILSIPDVSTSGPDIDAIDYHLQILQKLVLEKLTGRRRMKLKGLKEEFNKVHQVVEQTILAGEGNSMLVIGSRGCGKTALVESVLDDLSAQHRESFHIVRLNGFIHTDDKLALREIWRQLGREMEVEDELTSKTSSFADTLASLLALLSHPSEISAEKSDQTAKSVIFVLDEFDLFTTHPRQTLLYNLFDIAQSRKAPIAILGLTAKIDVVESLEKRVKSRFSHRYVHIPLPRSFGAFWQICHAGISIDLNEIVEQGFDPGLAGQDEFLEYWNSMLDTLYSTDALFKQHLQSQFYRSKSVSSFLTTCILPIASLTPSSLPLTGKSFMSTLPPLSPPDSKLHLLQSLAELDLAMLIAAARLDIILDTDTCNFAMAYDEYSTLTSKHKIQTSSTGVVALGSSTKVWGREVAMGSWERLVGLELLIPAGLGVIGSNGGSKEGRMWRVDVGLEEIPGSAELSHIMTKWCREI